MVHEPKTYLVRVSVTLERPELELKISAKFKLCSNPLGREDPRERRHELGVIALLVAELPIVELPVRPRLKDTIGERPYHSYFIRF